MFNYLRRVVGNFLVTFTNPQVNLWFDYYNPPPWGWYWATNFTEALDILDHYVVDKCRMMYSYDAIQIIDYLVDNPLHWPIERPEFLESEFVINTETKKYIQNYLEKFGPYPKRIAPPKGKRK